MAPPQSRVMTKLDSSCELENKIIVHNKQFSSLVVFVRFFKFNSNFLNRLLLRASSLILNSVVIISLSVL